jgi:hypothetical protein
MASVIKMEIASPKFKCLWEMPHKYRHYVFHSGRGTSKSASVARYILWACMEYKTRVLCVREIQKSIRESSHRLLRDLIELYNLTEFEVTDFEIRNTRTGSLITFSGLHSNIASIKSVEGVNILWAEEAQSISEESIEVLIPTIRKQNSILIWTLNPRFVSDPIYQMLIASQREDTLVVKLELEDNRFLPETLKSESDLMKKTNKEMWEWVYGGECLGSEDMTLIPQHLINSARVRNPVRNVDLAIVAGLDVSGLGADWTILVRRRGAEVLSVDRMHKGDVIAVADWAKDIYTKRPWDKIVIDASGSTGVYDLIRQWSSVHRQFQTYRFLGGSSPTRKDLYNNARTESWVRFRDWLSTGRITNHKEWDEACLVLYTFAEREQIKLLPKKDLKKSPDLIDAMTMSLWVDDRKVDLNNTNTIPTESYHGWIG